MTATTPPLSPFTRKHIVHWLCDTQQYFRWHVCTLHLGVNLFGRYIDKKPTTANAKLVAATAIWIAAKYEERDTPYLSDLVKVIPKSLSKTALRQCELDMLVVLDFKLNVMTVAYHVAKYDCVGLGGNHTIYDLVQLILEASLYYQRRYAFSSAQLAAAAFYLARFVCKCTPVWSIAYQSFSTYPADALQPAVAFLHKSLSTCPSLTRKKYQHISCFPLPSLTFSSSSSSS